MSQSNFTKKLINAGITANTDGLLRDLVARGMHKAAIGTIDIAIARRYEQIEFLKGFKDDLRGQVFEDHDV